MVALTLMASGFAGSKWSVASNWVKRVVKNEKPMWSMRNTRLA